MLLHHPLLKKSWPGGIDIAYLGEPGYWLGVTPKDCLYKGYCNGAMGSGIGGCRSVSPPYWLPPAVGLLLPRLLEKVKL